MWVTWRARLRAKVGAVSITGRERSLRQMVRVPAGSFWFGADRFAGSEHRAVRRVHVESFLIDEHPVTNAEFRRFQRATGYVTAVERPSRFDDRPGVEPIQLVPGSLVFEPTDGPVSLEDPNRWWRYVPGASWRQPMGPGSSIGGLDRHPVVHVTYEDALAFATWSGKSLPTESEWEYAARGGIDGASFPWGDDERPRGRRMANTWQGRFPWENLLLDGYERTSPIRSFPPNGYGLYDVVGNVWEWTSDWLESATPRAGAGHSKVVKGGSHLSPRTVTAPAYRPAARGDRPVDRATSDLGFRCIVR